MQKTVLGSVIAFLLAGGAAGYGYTVIRNNDADIFESSVHQVVQVVDGDTLDLENDVRIRLIGIDSPERGACGYDEASAFLESLVAGKHVRVEKDISGADFFDRLLRYVYLVADEVDEDDELVNDAMVRAGHAKTLAVAPDNRYRDLLATAQDEARRAGLGLWGACEQVDKKSEMQSDSHPADPNCLIKGNISDKSYGRNYFYEGCPNYNRIKVDTSKGEAYFCTEAEAEAAGFTRSVSCSNTF
ncbi:MAG: micrococcal nuclease [Candidatus Paceibacteria bacterium]|jgi:micrococcal nuclease